MSEKPTPVTRHRPTPPDRRRRTGGRAELALRPGSPTTPRLPIPPPRARLGRARDRAAHAPIVGWPHLLVNGSDAEFRRMVRALAALMHRLREVHALAARGVGLRATGLELLLAIVEADPDGDGVAQRHLASLLGLDRTYASQTAARLARAGMVVKRPDPVHRQRTLLVATDDGRRAVAAAMPLIKAAHNVAFQPLDKRAFERLAKIAAKLDTASSIAVNILARRTGEEPETSLRELRRVMRRLGGK